jgi:cold shock protein
MTTGTVRTFNDARGYGFITTESGDDVFVHYTEIQGEGFKTLEEDQEVEFDLYSDEKKGLVARNVKKVG